MKKLIKALCIGCMAIFMMGSLTHVAAWGNYFSMAVRAGGYRVGGGEMKKSDWDAAAVTPYSGLNGVYVTYRIRFSVGGGVATDYVDAYSYRTYTLPYYSGLAIKGERYIIASSMDAGQSRASATTTGVWAP